MSAPPHSPRFEIGFGLDRIGGAALRRPWLTGITLAIIVVVAVYGLFRVEIDRDLRNMFQGESDAYQAYVTVTESFVDPENQILILLQGPSLTAAANVRRLADLQLDLQFTAGVGSVFSFLSLSAPPDAEGRQRALIDPTQALTPDKIAAVRAHPLAGESLLSADGDTALMIVTPRQDKASLDELGTLASDINQLLPRFTADTGVEATTTGFAELRTEIVRLLAHDQLVLNGSGFVIGFILSLLMFRSLIAALMTALPATIAGVGLIGWSAALGLHVTIMSNVVPVLVMILGYTDGMHLTYAWRRYRDQGHSTLEAERLSLREVGPACMLAALTTAVAFLSMTISDVGMVRDFGWVGTIGITIGTFAILAAHGFAARILGPRWVSKHKIPETPLGRAAKPLAALSGFTSRRAWPVTAIAVPLTIAFSIVFLNVPPENSVRENLPSGSEAARALDVVDQELGGAFPVQVIVPLDGMTPTSPEGLARIRSVHEALTGLPGVHPPLSLWSIAAWLGVSDPAAASTAVTNAMAGMSEQATTRFLGAPGALVTVNLNHGRTAETKALVDTIEAAAHSAVPDAIVTGGTALSAREATRTIGNLNISLGTAVIVTVLLIALAFRRASMGLVALIPNLLPIVATGALLYILDKGMQFTSVVSLTIAYGIAVDDTVHYLNTLVREARARTLIERLLETSRKVGPVLVGTTIVIVTGLSMTLTSGLPTVATFGILAAASLLVAILGDLLVLPALIAGPFRRWFSTPAERGVPVAAPVREPAAE